MNNNFIHEQYRLVLLALSFFTRIPINLSGEVTAKMLNEASRYFGFVGIVVGVISGLIFSLFAVIFPLSIAIIMAMAGSVLLTGAFHEDGWADVWDGFGGGWTVENKLNIMKDSRLGTYGAGALFFILMLKFQALYTLAQHFALNNESLFYAMFSVLVLGHCLSRVVGTSLIADMEYVSEDARSKVKPLAQELSFNSYSILLITAAVVLAVTVSFGVAIKLIFVMLVVRFLLKKWFLKQLGGYTGDCLGAAQQLTEVVIYLALIIFYTGVL